MNVQPINIDPFLQETCSDTPLRMKWAVLKEMSYLALGLADGGVTVIACQESFGQLVFQSKWNDPDAHQCGVQDLEFCQVKGELYLATGGQDGKINIWKMVEDAWEKKASCRTKSSWVMQVLWLPELEVFVSASGKVLELWTVEGNKIIESSPVTSSILHMKYSRPLGKLLCSSYGQITLFDVNSSVKNTEPLEPFWEFTEKGSFICVDTPSDECVIAGGMQDSMVSLWILSDSDKDVVPVRKLQRSVKSLVGTNLQVAQFSLGGYHDKVNCVLYNESGSMLATTGGRGTVIWNFRDKKNKFASRPEQTFFLGPKSMIEKVAWKPNSYVIAGCFQNGCVSIWDTTNQKPYLQRMPQRTMRIVLAPWMCYNYGVDEGVDEEYRQAGAEDLVWHPSGKYLIVSFRDASVRFFAVPSA